MRTSHLALATVLAAAALSVQAGPRMESATSPFTYEAVGATPVVTLGRSAPKAAAAAKAADAPKAIAGTQAPAASRAAATSAFTYDALGATPHVELKKQPAKSEAQAPAAAH